MSRQFVNVSLCKYLSIVSGAAFLALLVGCGGGAGKGYSSLVQSEQGGTRQAALTAIQQKEQSLLGQPSATVNAAIAVFIKTLPAFEDSGVSADGCAWGRFTDGRMLVVINNDADVRRGSATSRHVSRAVAAPPRLPSGRAAMLPKSVKAYIMNAMEPARPDPSSIIVPELINAGYQVVTSNGTAGDWQNVQGAGILVVDCHGGSGQDRSHRFHFFMSTPEVATDPLDSKYKADLDSGMMGYVMVGLATDSTFSHINVETHYAVSADLVENRTTYSENSFVYSNACWGADAAAQFHGAGATEYAAWSDSVRARDTTDTAIYMLDRLFGTNKAQPVDPANPPPLLLIDAIGALSKAIRTAGSIGATMLNSDNGESVASLSVTKDGLGDFSNLVPIIENVTTDPTTNILTLTGFFGDKQGTVEVSGAFQTGPASLVSWSDSQISVAPAPGAFSVVVKVDGRPSNAFILHIPKLNPPTATIAPRSQATLTASVPGLDSSVSLAYDWSVGGGLGTISDSKGHSGTSFASTDSSVVYLAGSATGTDTVSVSVTAIQGNQRTTLGSAQASVTVTSTDTQADMAQVTVTSVDPAIADKFSPISFTVPQQNPIDWHPGPGRQSVGVTFTDGTAEHQFYLRLDAENNFTFAAGQIYNFGIGAESANVYILSMVGGQSYPGHFLSIGDNGNITVTAIDEHTLSVNVQGHLRYEEGAQDTGGFDGINVSINATVKLK